jgi:hypothetical protein
LKVGGNFNSALWNVENTYYMLKKIQLCEQQVYLIQEKKICNLHGETYKINIL